MIKVDNSVYVCVGITIDFDIQKIKVRIKIKGRKTEEFQSYAKIKVEGFNSTSVI